MAYETTRDGNVRLIVLNPTGYRVTEVRPCIRVLLGEGRVDLFVSYYGGFAQSPNMKHYCGADVKSVWERAQKDDPNFPRHYPRSIKQLIAGS